MRQVELDHLKTSIIALHEELQVVQDEGADAVIKREREQAHVRAAGLTGDYLDAHLQPQHQAEEEKNRQLEEELARETSEL